MPTLAPLLRRARSFALLLALAAARTASGGTWSHDPSVNVPVVTLPGQQAANSLVTDGSHGAIVVWGDPLADPFATPPVLITLHSSHVLPTGELDATWNTAGIPGPQANFGYWALADSAGGAFVVWNDLRNYATTDRDIYALHLLRGGLADPAWPAGGRAVCSAVGGQYTSAPIGDGHGGLLVFWSDRRDSVGTGWNAIYGAHVLASGTLDPAWPVNGLRIDGAPDLKGVPNAIPDGAGGALLVWTEYRTAGNLTDVYGTHVLANGTVDPAWMPDGLPIVTGPGPQNGPTLVSDGAGGFFTTWYDYYEPASLQHVLANGTVDPAWPAHGPVLDPAATSNSDLQLAGDGGTGVYVLYDAVTAGVANSDLYARHLLADGTFDPAWPADPVRLVPSASNKSLVSWSSPGAAAGGGVLFQWSDDRAGALGLYVDRLLPNGTLDPAWPALGRLLTPQGNSAGGAGTIDDGRDGTIFAWSDLRDSAATDWNVYADRFGDDGMRGVDAPEWHAVRDVPGDQGGKVSLQWFWSAWDNVPGELVTQYAVWRRLDGATPALASRARAAAAHATPQPGDVRLRGTGAAGTFWEFVGSTPARGTPNYALTVSTLADSTAAGNASEVFEIDADVSGGNVYSSVPDSGWSVDNLAPPAPADFIGTYASGTSTLFWDPIIAADLAGYHLYRGATPNFAPTPAARIATPNATHWTDALGHTAWYKVAGFDIHGNEGAAAAVLPGGGTTGVEAAPPPTTLALTLRSRSPARAQAAFALALPRAGEATLTVYDAGGRRVRTLFAGALDAGTRAVSWDLRDEGGRAVADGLYFVRLTLAGETRDLRLAIVR